MTKIICVGKKHEQIYRGAIEHFEGRIKPYTKLEWNILPSSSFEGDMARTDESARILSGLVKNDFVVLLDETGTNASSPDIAAQIEKAQNSSRRVVFVIGGAYGVDKQLKTRADFCLAFGKAVFPHQLMRVMLLEQIYRAHSILAGSKYHHS
jgi:23S rRNA (pseudouridine1915-N3)-methyltransferase